MWTGGGRRIPRQTDTVWAAILGQSSPLKRLPRRDFLKGTWQDQVWPYVNQCDQGGLQFQETGGNGSHFVPFVTPLLTPHHSVGYPRTHNLKFRCCTHPLAMKKFIGTRQNECSKIWVMNHSYLWSRLEGINSCLPKLKVQGFWVKEGLSFFLFCSFAARKTRNLALLWLKNPVTVIHDYYFWVIIQPLKFVVARGCVQRWNFRFRAPGYPMLNSSLQLGRALRACRESLTKMALGRAVLFKGSQRRKGGERVVCLTRKRSTDHDDQMDQMSLTLNVLTNLRGKDFYT